MPKQWSDLPELEVQRYARVTRRAVHATLPNTETVPCVVLRARWTTPVRPVQNIATFPPEDERMALIKARVPRELRERFNAQARRMGLHPCHVLRMLIEEFVEQHEAA
jgi:hypothetical protein